MILPVFEGDRVFAVEGRGGMLTTRARTTAPPPCKGMVPLEDGEDHGRPRSPKVTQIHATTGFFTFTRAAIAARAATTHSAGMTI